ncbi:MAG: hypothetical protein ABEJ05_05830 [Haloglomus sp.]
MTDEPDTLLSAPLASYLGSDESVEWRLTNSRSGVTRERGESTERIRPTENRGAVAAVTDHRVLFLVGGADDGDDHTASIPREELAIASVEEGMLARDFVVETMAGARWSFTVREPETLARAVEDLRGAIDVGARFVSVLGRAREARERAESAADPHAVADRYDAAVAAYRTAVSVATAEPDAVDADFDDLRAEVVAAVESALDANLQLAREERSRGNWDLQVGDEASAVDHLTDALDAFERARALADECPPGDPDAIAAERAALVEKLDSHEIQVPVAADDD